MIATALDFETTGLKAREHHVTEIGSRIYDFSKRKSLGNYSRFVHYPVPLALSEEIQRLTNIDQETYDRFGDFHTEAVGRLDQMIRAAEWVMSHNAEFEQGFIKKLYEGAGRELPEIKWIDTCIDIPYPAEIKVRKLTMLAEAHGIPVTDAHRAEGDIYMMIEIAKSYPVEAIIARAIIPTLKLQAHVHYLRKDDAKFRGFRWDGENKRWIKPIKENELEKELNADYPFKVEVVTNGNQAEGQLSF